MGRGRQFLLSGVAMALALLSVGWLTGLRHAMHAALLSVAAVALLPFLVIALCLGLAIVLAFLGAASHGGGDFGNVGLAEGAVAAGGSIPRYYRWLSSRRHPAFWGCLAGALLGGLLLWAWIGVAVVPGESRTAEILTDAKERLEKTSVEPVDGQLVLQDHVVVDGFGRPLHYERSGNATLGSFKLSSLGYDGKVGADDLCVSGSTHLLAGARLLALIGHGKALGPLADRLAAIQTLSCD